MARFVYHYNLKEEKLSKVLKQLSQVSVTITQHVTPTHLKVFGDFFKFNYYETIKQCYKIFTKILPSYFIGYDAPSKRLRHVEVPMMRMDECMKVHKEVSPEIPVTPNKNVCFGGDKGKSNICSMCHLSSSQKFLNNFNLIINISIF